MMEIMLDDSNDGFAHTYRICGGQHNLGEAFCTACQRQD